MQLDKELFMPMNIFVYLSFKKNPQKEHDLSGGQGSYLRNAVFPTSCLGLRPLVSDTPVLGPVILCRL